MYRTAFGKTSSNVGTSTLDEKIAQLNLKDAKALLAYRVKSLYEVMVVQQKAIEVRQKDLDVKQAYYKQAVALMQNGLKTKADASRFLSAVYSAKDSLGVAQSTFEKAKASLALYMGESIEDGVVLQTHLLEQKLSPSENIFDDVEKGNYQLKITTDTIQKNKLLHKSAKANHYGNIDAVGSYTHIDTLNTYDSKLAGVVVNIPLYSGGRVSAEVQKAKISQQVAATQKATKVLALKDELQGLLLDIQRYEKTIQAKKAQLESSLQTQEVLQGRYEEGLSTYIELLDATAIVLGARLALLEAYYQKSMAINRVEYLKGNIK